MANRMEKATEENPHLSSSLGEKGEMNGMKEKEKEKEKETKQEKETLKYISSICLYNYSQLILENEKNNTLYTIDMRTLAEYKAKHFKEAIHKNDKSKLKEIEHDIQIKKKPVVVFYGTEVNDESVKENAENKMETNRNTCVENIMEHCFNFIQNYFRNSKAQFYVLKEGFMEFEKKYPFLCLSTDDEESEKTNIVTPHVIASINYPLQIFENIYLGNFIHMNNPHIYLFLNIKHVYDFTASGFSKQMHQKVRYHRYDVFKKKFRKRNFSEKEPITFANFLSLHFMHDVICNIAKHDKTCYKRVRVGDKGYQNKDANMETKTKAREENTREEIKLKNEQNYEQKERSYNAETDSSLEARISTEYKKGVAKENRNKNETQGLKQESAQEQEEKEQEQVHEQETESENEENTKEHKKTKSMLILCNDGLKNQEKTKINSISLIICMCYVMFRNKCSENFAVARFLKICNELEINAHTYSFLKNFYHYLESNNFCLEHKKERSSERRDSDGNIENMKNIRNIGIIGKNGQCEENQNRETSQKNQRHIEQRKSEPNNNSRNMADYVDSNYFARNSSGSEFEDSRNKEKIENVNIRKLMLKQWKDSDSEESDEEEYKEIINDGMKRTKNSGKKKRRFEKALIEISKNDMCKRVFSSFKIKERCIIFEKNENNVLYMKYEAPDDTNKNIKQYDASTIMSKELLLYYIIKNVKCDYERLLASILYNIYTDKMKLIGEIDLCVPSLFDATEFEKHDIFVTMPYISLILYNICVLNNKEVYIHNITDRYQMSRDKRELSYWIMCLLERYIVNSIIYILKNVQTTTTTTKINELKITFHMTEEQLREAPVSKEIFLVLAALKYFLITLLHFYVKKCIKNLYVAFFVKLNERVLRRVNEFAEFYYSVYNIDINKFLKAEYLPQVDPHDNLPYYFSDILRPFIILYNHFNE